LFLSNEGVLSTVAVQTKGLGSSFQASRYSAMAFSRSATLKNVPRRMHSRDNSPNHRSTKFNQLASNVCRTLTDWKRGRLHHGYERRAAWKRITRFAGPWLLRLPRKRVLLEVIGKGLARAEIDPAGANGESCGAATGR